MTVSLIRVQGDFAVARPIPWDDRDTLRDHVDRVVDALMLAASVVEVETEARLEEGNVKLAVVLAAADAEGADLLGRATLAASIPVAPSPSINALTCAAMRLTALDPAPLRPTPTVPPETATEPANTFAPMA